ncbi:MAG TPA: DUF3551 domain-containing protein [Pseudolabrys sp.]|nr:DUF3551 domain-containing protein [Pseudolabrys sp.]
MRITIFAALAAAPLLLIAGTPAAHAQDGPWCGVQQRGGMSWNCSFQTLEQCRQEMVAGNRGYCNQNPSFFGRAEGPRPRRHRHRYEPR